MDVGAAWKALGIAANLWTIVTIAFVVVRGPSWARRWLVAVALSLAATFLCIGLIALVS